MSAQDSFVRVASVDEVPEGKPKAVKVDGKSVALFFHEDAYYATDNQCPHMGYPLVRGRVRNGVLTCDWHGWSYDMRGGGCFTGGCDDIEAYPVEVRNGDIWVDVNGHGSAQGNRHFLLLEEGLLSGDDWTLAKAIAMMLARGVSEEETLKLLVVHMGRHIATERGPDGGNRLALTVNGVKVARRYEGDDRLIPLMMAAQGASGRAGDRPPIRPLPPPVTWEKLRHWVGVFADDRNPEGIEKCLITARGLGGHDDEIIPLLYESSVQPFFLGHSDNLLHLGYLAELLEEFGWGYAEQLVCNLGAKILGRGRGAPDEHRREGINRFTAAAEMIDGLPGDGAASLDEDAFAARLVSGDVEDTFGAVTDALQAGVAVENIATTMVMLAADRMARTPLTMSPGWGQLAREMTLASSVRTSLEYAGFGVAARALYHVAWQFYSDRWLNIPVRPMAEIGKSGGASIDEDAALAGIVESIEAVRVREVGRETRAYLAGGGSGDRLLSAMGQAILKDDHGWNLLHALRTVGDEWETCASHPARGQMLVGLARWATDVRKATGSDSAAQTAHRFAKGLTAVDLYEA